MPTEAHFKARRTGKETQLYHAAWKKALAEGQVTITLRDVKALHKLRFALYGALRQVKAGNVQDPQLQRCCEECMITVDTKALTLTIQRIDQKEELQSLAMQLGVDLEGLQAVEGPILPQEEGDDAAQSALAFLERLKAERGETPTTQKEDAPCNAQVPATPYYSR